MDATTNALPTALGLGLGFGFIVVVLSVAKLWYAKHRRIQLIHAPPPSRSLPLYHEMSMSMRSSRSTLASRPSVAEFGIFDTPSLGSTTISPSSTSSPMMTPRDFGSHGVLVGLLGSPDWEIQLTRGVDKTARTEAIEYAEDDIMRAVHALPTRSLSRMSSKVSLVHKKGVYTFPTPTGVSPLLGTLGSSPSLLSASSPAFHYLPRLISSPATPSSQHAPLISTSPFSPKAAVLLDLFPVDAPMLPPKAASLLDMTSPRATASSPRTMHAIPAVTTTVASPTASIIGVPATLRSPALSIAPKAIDRLGVHVPLGPPSPTWSEYSTSSLQFYGSTPAAAGGLGLKLGYRASHGVHTRASSCALPADELGRLERARAGGHKPRSSVSSTATKSSTHSIRRKPVPAWDDAPPSPSADSIHFSVATPPPTLASSSCRPSGEGPRYHGKSASTGARVTFAELPLPPRPAARRTRSVEALNGRPTTPAVGDSTPYLVVSDPPARKLVKSPSMPMLTTGLGILTAAPPQINVIEPSPVKRPTSVGNFNGAISDAHGMLVIPDWSPSTPGGVERTQPTAAQDVDEAPPSPTDSGIHVALHPMVRTQRSPPHSRAPSPAPSHASVHSTSALSSRASTPTPTPAGGDAPSSLPRRRRARPVDIRTALGPTTRPLNTSPTGSTFTFGQPPTREGSFESARSDRSLGVPADAKASTGGRMSLHQSLSSSKSAPSLRSRRRENVGGPDHGKMDFVCRGEGMAAAVSAQDRVHGEDLPGAPSSRPLESSSSPRWF